MAIFSFLGTLALYLVPTTLLMTFCLLIGAEIWIRRAVRGGTLFVFWDESRNMSYKLVKIGPSATVVVGDETYTIQADRRYLVQYPFGFPSFVQETVACYYFKDNFFEPIDPVESANTSQLVSAKMLSNLTDEAMLTATVREAREAAEGSLLPTRNLPIFIALGVGATAILSGGCAYLIYKMGEEIALIIELLQGVSN